MTRTTDPQFT